MAEKVTVSVTISLPWWTNLYLDGLKFCCFITGYEPDESDMHRWAQFIADHSKVQAK